MKMSRIGFKSTKLKDLDEMFPAQDILIKTNQLVMYESGIYGYDYVPYMVEEKVKQIITEELDKVSCVKVNLPLLQPANIWKKSGRWDKYIEEGVMFTVETDKSSYGLAPTAEEAIVEFAKKRLTSYKSMPVTYYQIGEKFRNEIRTRGFLLRGKTFTMMDAYSFDVSLEDSIKSYDKIREAYFNIFNRLGLEVIPVIADNGSIGGKKSEEFMVLTDSGEDRILVDKETGRAFNIEILEKENYQEYLKCEYGLTNLSNLEEKRAMELGHIFQLGDKYSTTMDAKFTTKDNQMQPYYMGCYGIGVSRVVALLYEKNVIIENGKVTGICLPEVVSPFKLYIVMKLDNQKKVEEALRLYEVLSNKGIKVMLDDRDLSIGSKIKDAKVLGVPYVAILGDNTEDGQFEIENNRTSEKIVVKLEEYLEH